MPAGASGRGRQRQGRRRFLAIALTLVVVLTGLRLADPAPVAEVREAYFDRLQQIWPRPAADLPVRVVDIDETSLTALGQWPWPRGMLADLVDRLAAMGAAVVVFDVLFPEPDRLSPSRLAEDPALRAALGPEGAARLAMSDNDARFAAALARQPAVLGIAAAGPRAGGVAKVRARFAEIGPPVAARLTDLGPTTPIVPVLAAAAQGIGSINVSGLTGDGRIRAVPLVWRGPSGIVPSLALEALRVAAGETTVLLHGGAAGLEMVSLAGINVPVAPDGSLRLRYRRDDPGLYLSARDVLDPAAEKALRSRIEGQIVFVGTSAAGLEDIRTTALGEAVPGVSIHAQIVEQMLTGAHLMRGDAVAGAELLVLVVLGVIVAVRMTRAGPLASVLLGGGAAAVVLGASVTAFQSYGVLFDATFPMLGGFVAFSVLSIYQYAVADREKRLIRRSFARYVAPGVLDEIEQRGHELQLGGEMRDVTVMFCDVRNFSALSDAMQATELVSMLNGLFTDLSVHILATRGTIDKFIGDEIMAFWNAPLDVPGHERAAGESCLRMRAALDALSARRLAEGASPIAMSMGLASGIACVGNMGSRDRFNYTVMGDTVNLAARIENACRHVHFDIVVSGAVAEAAAGLALLPAGWLDLKGVSDRLQVHVLVGGEEVARSAAFATLRGTHVALAAALGEGADPAGALAQAREAAALVDPRLDAYLRRMVGRPGDFRDPTAVARTSRAG